MVRYFIIILLLEQLSDWTWEIEIQLENDIEGTDFTFSNAHKCS